jgi:hypothetical protein
VKRVAVLPVLVAVAFGCGGEDSDFSAGERAPLPVAERLVEEATAERITPFFTGKPNVIAESAYGVAVAGVPRPLFFNPRVTGPKRTVIETTDSRGRPLRLSVIPIEGGERCVERQTRNGTSTGCGSALWTDEGIQVHPTLMGSMVFVSSSVGREVAKLELHHQDGHVLELPIVERFVLHDVPRARFEDGRRPILLVARNGSGEEVAREKVGQRPFAPNSAIWSGGDVGP